MINKFPQHNLKVLGNITGSTLSTSGNVILSTGVGDGPVHLGTGVFMLGASGGSTSPAKIDLGQSYSTLAGSGLKISLYGNDQYGFGVSPGNLDYVTASFHRWYQGATERMHLSNVGALYLPNLSASLPVFTDTAKYLVNRGINGSGNVVLASGASLVNPLLTDINGDARVQIYNDASIYLRGVTIVTGYLLANNQIISEGSSAGFSTYERNGSSKYWTIYSSYGELYFWNAYAGGIHVGTVTSGGNWTIPRLSISGNAPLTLTAGTQSDGLDAGNGLYQIKFAYPGGGYANYIKTRHNNNNAGGNAFDFYTCNSTANGIFPTGSNLALTLENTNAIVPGCISGATLSITGSTTLNTVVANTINAGSIVGTTVVGSSIFGYTITGSNILSWGGIYQAYGNAETGYFEAGAPYRYSQGAAYVTGNGDNIGNYFSYRCNFGTYINYSSSGQSGYGFWSNWGYPYMWMEVIHGAHGSWNGLPSDSPIKDTYIYQQIKGPEHNGIGAPVKSTSGNSTFLFGVKGNGDFHVSGNIVGYGLTVTGGLNVGSSIYASSFIATGAGGGLFLRDRSNQNKFFEYYVDNGTLYLGTTENGYQLVSYITSGGSACFARGLTVTGGNITAVGGITASAGYITSDGGAAGFQFADRSDTANRWWWYTVDNVARLYLNSIGDIMSVTNIGGIVFHGQGSFTSSGKTNIRNTTTILGSTTVSGFFANSGWFVDYAGNLSNGIYEAGTGYYVGPQGAVFRLDHTGTHLHNIPAALVIYNGSGVNGDWAKLTFAGRESSAGNSIALAGIAVQSHDKAYNSWGHGDLVIWNKAHSAENETVRVVSDGRVGIGTATPSAHLHVTGDIRAIGINIIGSSSVISSLYLGPNSYPAGYSVAKLVISGGSVSEANENGPLTIIGIQDRERLYMGMCSTGAVPYAYIQSIEHAWSTRELKLNPMGGSVSVGGINTDAKASLHVVSYTPELPSYERGTVLIAGTGRYSRLTLGVDDSSRTYGWIQALDTTQAARVLCLQPLGGSPVVIGTTGNIHQYSDWYSFPQARGGLYVTGGGYFGNQVTVSGDVLLGAGSKLRISEVSTHYPVPVLKFRSDQVLVLGNFGGEYHGGTMITEGNMGGNVIVSLTTGHTGLGTAGEFAVGGRQWAGGEDTTATYFKAGQTGVSSLVPFTVTGRLSAGNINSTGAIIATNSYIQARGSNNSIKFEDVNDPSNIWKIHNVDNVTYLNSTSPGNILSITNGGNVGVTGSLTAASLTIPGNVIIGGALTGASLTATGRSPLTLAAGSASDGTDAGKGLFQLKLCYPNAIPSYAHHIKSRHSDSTPIGNAIDFYTCDGTQYGIFPTGSNLALTLENTNLIVPGRISGSSITTTGAFIIPSVHVTGTISGSAGIFSSQTLVGSNSLEISKIFEHNLNPGVNDVAYICQVYSDDGAAYIDVSLSTEQGGLSMAYKYLIPVQYNGTSNNYREVLPIAQNRYYGSEKITLDVSVSNATATIRLRRVSGTVVPVLCHTLVRAIGRNLVIAALSTTGVDASVTSKYGSAIITQSDSMVGINTQDATSLLHIVGAGTPNLGDNGIVNIESFGRSGLAIGWDYASSSAFLYSRIVGSMRTPINLNGAMYVCDAYGNDYVGIGQSNPSQKLDVSGNIRVRGTVVIQPVPIVGGYDYQPPVTLLSAYYTYASGSAGTSFHLNTITGGGYALHTTYGNPLSLGVAPSDFDTAVTTPARHINIINGGNVGIGQITPTEKLEVSGNLLVKGQAKVIPYPTVGGHNARELVSVYDLYNNGANGHAVVINSISGVGFNIATTWGAPLALGVGSSGSTPMNPPKHLTILFDGCVGIGTYNPSCLLELYGEAPRLKLTDSVNQDWSVRASGHHYYVRDESNGFDPFHLYAGGGFALLGNAGNQNLIYGQSLGQVGFGTVSPQAHVHVTGNILASSLTISGANGYSGVGINCKPINGYALSITGIVSLNYQTVNASSLQFWDSNYGIGMDSSDLVLTTNSACGVSFKTTSVGGTLIGKISAAEAKFPAKAYVAGITTLGSGLEVSGKSHFYTGARFDHSIASYSYHTDGYGSQSWVTKYDNVASYSYGHWSQTGIIDIKMPLGFSPPTDANVMGCFIVEGQQYDGNGAWKLYAYGYTYQEGYWVNTSAHVEGYTPFTTVRFSMLDGTGHLLIGETGTNWMYPQFRLGFVQGHNTYADYSTGWNMSMIRGLGAMSGITNVPLYASRTYNDGNHHFHKINVATSLTVNGNSVVSGNSTTYGTIYAYNNLLTSAGNLSLVPGAGALFLDTTLSNDIFFRPNSIAVATLGLDGQFKCKHGFFTGNVAVTGQLSVTGAVIGSSYIKTQGTSNGFYFEDINDPANSWRLYNVDNITYLKSASPGNVFSVSSAGAVTTSGSLTVTGVNIGAHISSTSVHGVGTVVGTTESQSLTNKTITGRSNFNMATHLVTTSGGNYIALTGNVAIYAGQVLYSATTGQALWKTLAKSFGGSTSINLNGTTNVTTTVSTSVDMAQAYISVTSTESDPGVAQALFSVNNKVNGAFDINATSLNNSSATIGVDWMAIINEP